MSRNPKHLNGVLNIDKPPGLTSHDVVNHVREIIKVGLPAVAPPLGGAKVGHAGTLDPFATGVLLVLVGSATRLMEYVNLLSKTYQAEITLGATSDTDDITGRISKPKTHAGKTLGVSPSTPRVKEARVKKVLASFVGPQLQTPPSYSAIKVKGRQAYEAARRGSPLKLPPRHITIHNIQLIDYNHPILSIKVTCGSGTYIRALARDIGSGLGIGAYVSKLRRTSIGPLLTKPKTYMKPISGQKFNLKNAIRLNQLITDNLLSRLLPPSTLVAHLPSITLTPPNVAQLKEGQPIEWGTVLPEQKPIALFTKDGHLLGIGRFDPATKLLSPDKIL